MELAPRAVVFSMAHGAVGELMFVQLAFTKDGFDLGDIAIDFFVSASHINVVDMFGSAEIVVELKFRVV